jgi:hypothetical protein
MQGPTDKSASCGLQLPTRRYYVREIPARARERSSYVTHKIDGVTYLVMERRPAGLQVDGEAGSARTVLQHVDRPS